MSLRICVSPHGRLSCEPVGTADRRAIEAGTVTDEVAARRIEQAFAESSAAGLSFLAGQAVGEPLPADLVFWRDWSRIFFQDLCRLDEQRRAALAKTAQGRAARSEVAAAGDPSLLPPPDDSALAVLVAAAPPMHGLEYLTPELLKDLWAELTEYVCRRASETPGGLAALLRRLNPFWQLLGRVTFHLAENKRDQTRPFAFLATYTHRLSASASLRHLPLSQALKQYASGQDRAKLAELLTPVRAAAERSELIRDWLDSRALFQPQSLTIAEAYRFLRDVPQMEQCGLVVRVPNWWQPRKPPRPTVQVRLGEREPNGLGTDSLLDFSIELALDGEPLTAKERAELLAGGDGLMLLRGKWVEVNPDKLTQALDHWQQLAAEQADGVDFLQGMRLLAGASLANDDDDSLSAAADWSSVAAGDWLRQSLASLRDPRGVIGCTPGEGLRATLRPYQQEGVRWLWFLTQLRLGACLADDMGLGKTIQVIDLLLRLKSETDRGKPAGQPTPSLLIVPASLLGNWKQELARFAPQLRVFFAHPSECDSAVLNRLARQPDQQLAGVDLLVTTYTLVRKAQWLGKRHWQLVILDEAQAIKNSASAQTKAVKKLPAGGRIALTGTPVENQLGDLWSLFDFCCPGLLGTARQFKDFVKRLNQRQDSQAYGALRRLVQPYILRRLKTDPRVAPELPKKTEMRVDCGLAKKQVALYQRAVEELAQQLQAMDESGQAGGIRRRGIVLATMLRMKQICNHPAQYLNRTDFVPGESGKFARLAELCEPIAERQEKVLVFTQFQSLCQPLADYLAALFGHGGLVLHGGVAVGKRKELVRRFQEDDRLPFFVISVKAGGTGLNLTAASHVVHFDRWWNPAVENQATDRAFRIGQRRNVLVHKFVCRGTLEERIDEMLEEKQQLADKILGPTREGETLLTEMPDKELLRFVALDIGKAAAEE